MRWLIALLPVYVLAAPPAAVVDELSPLSVATEHIVGYWSFDGESLRDMSGNGYDAALTHGDFHGGPGVVSAGAAYMEDLDSYTLEVGNEDAFDVKTNRSLSVSFWIKGDGAETAGLPRKSRGAPDDRLKGWMIRTGFMGQAGLRVYLGAGSFITVNVATTMEWPPDEWTHYTAVIDREAGELRLFRNGEYDNSADISSVGDADNDDAVVLCVAGGGENYLDEIIIHQTALAPAQIRRLCNIGLSRMRSR